MDSAWGQKLGGVRQRILLELIPQIHSKYPAHHVEPTRRHLRAPQRCALLPPAEPAGPPHEHAPRALRETLSALKALLGDRLSTAASVLEVRTLNTSSDAVNSFFL